MKKLYALNCPELEKQLAKNYVNTKKLTVKTVLGGIILPVRDTKSVGVVSVYEGGLCDEKYNLVVGYRRRVGIGQNQFEIVRAYTPDVAPAYIDEDVIFAGIGFSHFGHFLLESLCRLWWVIKNKEFSKKIIFLKNIAFDESKYSSLLELCGLDLDRVIYLEQPTQFKSVTVPDQSLMFFDYYTHEFITPYNKILENITASNHKKIYLSRTKFIKQDHVNEIYFENFYRNLGYYIVYPEKIDIREQIALIAGADEIVSTMGTISHLAIFCKPKTKLITFLRSRNSISAVQLMINAVRDLDFSVVDVTINILPSQYSTNCFFIGPTSSWRLFCKEHYQIDIQEDMVSFLNSANSHFGTYLKLWRDTYSKRTEFNKIKNHSMFNTMEQIDVTLSENTTSYETKISQVMCIRDDPENLFALLKNKIFRFSHYDDAHPRHIFLKGDMSIVSLTERNYDNEVYWNIVDGQLVFQSKTKEITSRYAYLTVNDSVISSIGVFVKNPKILFKLSSVHLA